MNVHQDAGARRRRSLAAGLALAAALLAMPADAAQGRRGASVVVTTNRRGEIAGELVAVRSDGVLVLAASGTDISIDPADVRLVRISRPSKGGLGGLLGLVSGAAVGYLGGTALAISSGACPDCEAPLTGYAVGFIGAFIGLGAGVSLGEAAGRDMTISLDAAGGRPSAASLGRLRRYARVRDYR